MRKNQLEIRVLLVEDDPEHRALIERALKRLLTYRVETVSVGLASEAERFLEENKCDVVLLDLSLPDSRPDETLRRIVQIWPELPVIVMTSLQDERMADKAIELGAQEFLEKSELDPELISRSFRSAIGRKAALNQLRKQNETLRAFSHTVAHEVKTPLQGILTSFYLLREIISNQPTDDKSSKMFQLGIDSATHLSKLVDELLAFAKFESRDLIGEERVELDEVISEIVAEAEAINEPNDITFVVHPAPFTVKGSRLQVRQVLSNLVTNAIKYRSSDPLRVEISVTQEDDQCVVCVEDTGRGIHPNDLHRIFNLFYRGDSTESDQEGSGIGLSFCKQIIERANGRMWAESELGKGTRLCFTLPLAETDNSKNSKD